MKKIKRVKVVLINKDKVVLLLTPDQKEHLDLELSEGTNSIHEYKTTTGQIICDLDIVRYV